MNKKGDYKYGLMFSLIMGLLVIGLSFYFIFNELFTEDELSYEVCRQSIIARSVLPDVTISKLVKAESFKDSYPLKCETRVVEIDKSDLEDMKKTEDIIAEEIVKCWALFDKGDASAFPPAGIGELYSTVKTTCVSCSRIHLTDEAEEYLKANPGVEINIRNALDGRMEEGFSYYNYLINSGEKFSAFDLATARPFDLETEDVFLVDDSDQKPVIFRNRLTGATEDGHGLFFDVEASQVYLPERFDFEKGDLLINYGIMTSSNKGKIGGHVPYLFYFQAGDSDAFQEVGKELIDGSLFSNAKFCDQWEGVPL
ncbi:hypothetical protein HNV12_16950 [Methanococcoides sp. SA1]|nr:hypothetical protein [Methanococcoides sp. SA1]